MVGDLDGLEGNAVGLPTGCASVGQIVDGLTDIGAFDGVDVGVKVGLFVGMQVG